MLKLVDKESAKGRKVRSNRYSDGPFGAASGMGGGI